MHRVNSCLKGCVPTIFTHVSEAAVCAKGLGGFKWKFKKERKKERNTLYELEEGHIENVRGAGAQIHKRH